jgi:hypothetical protein
MKIYPLLIIALVLGFCLGCATAPIRWVSTPEYPDMDYDRAWQIIVSTITEDFEIDVIEKDSGYLMTAWKTVSMTGKEFLSDWNNAGVKVICKVENRDPFKLKIKVQRGTTQGGTWVAKSGDEKLEAELFEQIKLRLK